MYKRQDQSLGPIQLSEVQQSTDLAVDDLPGYARSRVEDTIAADDLGHAESIVLGLRSDAARSDRERQEAEDEAQDSASREPSPGSTGTVNYPESSRSADEGGEG